MDAKKRPTAVNYAGTCDGCELNSVNSILIAYKLKGGRLFVKDNKVLLWEKGTGSFVLAGFLYKKESPSAPYTRAVISNEEIVLRIQTMEQEREKDSPQGIKIPRPPLPSVTSEFRAKALSHPSTVKEAPKQSPKPAPEWQRTPYHVLGKRETVAEKEPMARFDLGPKKKTLARLVYEEPKEAKLVGTIELDLNGCQITSSKEGSLTASNDGTMLSGSIETDKSVFSFQFDRGPGHYFFYSDGSILCPK